MIPVERLLAAAVVLLLYAALCGAVWRDQRRRRERAQREARALMPAAGDAAPVLVAFASQTGQAEALAWQTARALHAAGVPAQLRSFAQLTLDDLRRAGRALLITSTYGEGDPPDAASGFARQVMGLQPAPSLQGLHCGVLALGDRSYAQFCGFGRRLDDWLRACGASALFERVDVDAADPAAVANWRGRLARLTGGAALPAWESEPPRDWRLASRRLLNPGSQGGPCYHLVLQPAAGAWPEWQSGDLVQLQPPGDAERPRDYSIASVPADGSLQLLVRQERHADGSLGLASGWLTEGLAPGDSVPLRLRPHAGFRLGDNAGRRLILIGNGTGLAGLLGHLRALAAARAAHPAATPGGHWLVFGEREAAHDDFFAEDIAAWQDDGLLGRVDRVYSRDQPERRYVQHRLAESAAALREAVDDGAAIYVCGSLDGMAAGVESALVQALGEDALQRLRDAGRYRRDVY